MAKTIPDGYHAVTPYLMVRGAQRSIDFLKKTFGAELPGEPIKRPDGSIMHATIKIGDSLVMVSDATEQHPPMPSMLYVYVPNVDAAYQCAVAAGGSPVMEPMDQFYGDRSGGVKDPSGNQWRIGTHKEDVTPAELKRRAEAHLKAQQAKPPDPWPSAGGVRPDIACKMPLKSRGRADLRSACHRKHTLTSYPGTGAPAPALQGRTGMR